jgi:hypothetical protein
MTDKSATVSINTIATWLTILTLLGGGVVFFSDIHSNYVTKDQLEKRLLEIEVKYIRELGREGVYVK